MTRRVIATMVVLALALGACGGDPSGSGGTGGSTASGGTGGSTASGGSGGSGGSTAAGPKAVAISAAYESSCALLEDGQIKCWGLNGHGQLGQEDTQSRGDAPGEMGASLKGVGLGDAAAIASFSGRNEHVCTLDTADAVRCWGMNGNGQLGLGDATLRGDKPGTMGAALPVTDDGPDFDAAALAAGSSHTCAVSKGGVVRCWGNNGACELGTASIGGNVGDAAGEMGAALKDADIDMPAGVEGITAGGSHTCALDSEKQLKCWGANTSGQLGLGDGTARGCSPATSGSSLSPVDVGSDAPRAVSAGGRHTCVVTVAAEVKCWGENDHGQLGLGHADTIGDDPTEMGAALAPVDLGGEVAEVSAGDSHTCALFKDGRVKCWGANPDGRLGLGHTMDIGDDPGEMGDALPFVDLGAGATAVEIRAGFTHTCARLDDGTVKCWGSGAAGALGQGSLESIGDEAGEMGDALPATALF